MFYFASISHGKRPQGAFFLGFFLTRILVRMVYYTDYFILSTMATPWIHAHKTQLIVGALALFLLLSVGSCFFGGASTAYETEAVRAGDVVEKVRVTGQVQAQAVYELSFEIPGTL